MTTFATGHHRSLSSMNRNGDRSVGNDGDDSVDIDRLFREVQASCRQHDRDRSSQSLSKAMLEFHASVAEEQMQAARLRSAELSRRSTLLEQALLNKRSQYAARLRPSLRDPVADSGGDDVCEDAQHSVSAVASGGGPDSCPTAEVSNWRYFEGHLPRTRKRLVRAELVMALQSIGIEHAESLFEEPLIGPAVGKDPDTGAGGHVSSVDDPSFMFAPQPRTKEGSSSSAASGCMPWGWKATLRSHLDAVRCVAVCADNALLSCGEDAVIKAWSLTPLSGSDDIVEPYATFRGHNSAVLSLAHMPGDGYFFSGGTDGEIRAWHLPAPGEHDLYGPSPTDRRTAVACRQRVSAHRDAVWSLCLSPELGLLASTGADRSIRLWRPYSDEDAMLGYVDEFLRVLGPRVDGPTSLSWAPRAGGLLAGFTSSACVIFDAEAGAPIRAFELSPEEYDTQGESAAGVLSVACHPTLDIAAASHADRCVRLFSLSAGCVVQFLTGHEDAVTSVAFNPCSQFEVATGSHDGILRLFDIRTGNCLRQVPVHERKFGEAIHKVCHAGDRVFTAGADANVCVLGLAE